LARRADMLKTCAVCFKRARFEQRKYLPLRMIAVI
jgi:hypothetical protein